MSYANTIAHIHSLYRDHLMVCGHCGTETRVEWQNMKLWEWPADQWIHIGDPGETIPVAPLRTLDDGSQIPALPIILDIMGLFIEKHQGCRPQSKGFCG